MNLTDEHRAMGRAVRTKVASDRAAALADVVADVRTKGFTTFYGMAAELNRRQIATPRGGHWSAIQVKRLLARMPAANGPERTYARPSPTVMKVMGPEI